MKHSAKLSLAILSLAHACPLRAQNGTPPPEITPRPSASPAASATPANSSQPIPNPVPSPRPPVVSAAAEPRASVDALAPADVQEALRLLKENAIEPGAFTEPELARATLQGLLERTAPRASLVPAAPQNAEPSPFYSEVLDDRTGYLRIGELSKNSIGELDAALGNLREKAIRSAILDLRAMPMNSDFQLAAEVAKRFCTKGKPLFVLKKNSAVKQPEQMFTSNIDPAFRDLLVVLVDGSDAGAAEVIAAVLRTQTGALIVGEKTAGRAFEFTDLPLRGGATLRVAVAEAALPDGSAIARDGVKPDIVAEMSEATRREVLRVARENGVAAVVTENERSRMNEAALVAGRNPEIDALQAAQQRGKNPEKPKAALDTQLERALDLITSISVFETKRAAK